MGRGSGIVEVEPAAVEQAQLHLALSSVTYMCGQGDRARSEAEAVLSEPGLPEPLYVAAEQRRLLAVLAEDGDVGDVDERRDISGASIARAALAWRDGNVGDALERLWLATRTRPGRPVDGAHPGLCLAVVLTALGQVDDAQACIGAAADELAIRSDPLWAPAPAVFSARIALVAGDVDGATRTARSGLELTTRLATPMLAPVALDVLASAALLRGDLAQAAEHVETWRAASRTGRLPFGVARRHWAALRLREARGEEVLGDGATEATFDLVAYDQCLLLEEPSAAAWLVRVVRRHGDESRVERVVRMADRLATLNRRYPTVVAAAAHARGVARCDARDVEQAADGYRAPWARASAAEDAAVLHRDDGERGVARSWLERAAEGYAHGGADRDGARIRSRMRELGARRRHWSHQERPVSGWESLTDTERAVATLVAEGLSNLAVAERMFVSRHTVDSHLRHIYRKLGIDSRVLLTRIEMTCDRAPS